MYRPRLPALDPCRVFHGGRFLNSKNKLIFVCTVSANNTVSTRVICPRPTAIVYELKKHRVRSFDRFFCNAVSSLCAVQPPLWRGWRVSGLPAAWLRARAQCFMSARSICGAGRRLSRRFGEFQPLWDHPKEFYFKWSTLHPSRKCAHPPPCLAGLHWIL